MLIRKITKVLCPDLTSGLTGKEDEKAEPTEKEIKVIHNLNNNTTLVFCGDLGHSP